MERPQHREFAPAARSLGLTSLLNVSLFFLVFAITLLWPLLRGALYWGDIQFYFEPMWRFGQQELRQGRIPLWNGLVLAGQPFLGNPQMGVFYPTTLCLFVFPVWMTLGLASILHIALCGLFTYAFLRRWVAADAALLGAMVYMGSDCLLGRVQFPPMIYTAAYFPFLLWQLDRCLEKPELSRYAWLAVAVGLMLLAGHAQFAYFILGCVILYALVRLWRTRSRFERPGFWLRPAIPLIGAGLLGLLLAAVQIVPTLQLLDLSPRDKLTPLQANRFVLDFPQLLQVLWPRFFGHPAARDFWWRGNAWEPACFIGWLPLLLAGYAIWKKRNSAKVRFWGLAGGFGLWLAFGLNGGLYAVAFYILPGLANFHDPARFLLIAVFAASVLAAEGWETWRSEDAKSKKRLFPVAAALVAMPLTWFAGDWNPTTNPAAFTRPPRAVRFLRPMERNGRTYLPAHDLLWKEVVTDGYDDYGESDARTVAFQRETLISNLGMQFGLSSASGYEPVPVAMTAMVDGLGRMAAREGQPNLTSLMSLTRSDVLILPAFLRFNDPAFRPMPSVLSFKSDLTGHRERSGRVQIWVKATPAPAAWIVSHLRNVEGKTRLAAALAAPNYDPANEAIVSGISNLIGRLSYGERATWRSLVQDENGRYGGETETSPFAVQVAHSREGRFDILTPSRKTPGLLVVPSVAYPGWKARVDGKTATVVRANGVMLGVPLASGPHTIRLTYAPDSYRIGLYLSLMALLIVSLMVGFTSAGETGWLRIVLRRQNAH